MRENGEARVRAAFNTLVGVVLVLTGLILLPPVFERTLAVAPLLGWDQWAGGGLATALLVLGAFTLLRRARGSVNRAVLLFGLLLLLWMELGYRVYLSAVDVRAQRQNARFAALLYDESFPFASHPFLQYTGRPMTGLIGNRAFGNIRQFNNYGFPGRDFHRAKNKGVVRVLALGASTTATGYPRVLEKLLNKEAQAGQREVEVFNMALGGYTTNHSVTNYLMNGRDFQADAIVIHHAWNDGNVRGRSAPVRGDYAHYFKAMSRPVIVDRYILRASAIYRDIKRSLFRKPPWAYIKGTLVREDAIKPGMKDRFANPDELRVYKRNIRTMIQLARLDRVGVVLTTMPYAQRDTLQYSSGRRHTRQANEALREIAAQLAGPDLLFVDLDKLMTGPAESMFSDSLHLSRAGRAFKARLISQGMRTWPWYRALQAQAR